MERGLGVEGGGVVCEVLRAGYSKLLVGKWLRLGVQLPFIISGLVWYFY